MKVKALKKRAKEIGVDEEKLDDADDADDVKGVIIELIVEQDQRPAPQLQPQPEPEPAPQPEPEPPKSHFGAKDKDAGSAKGADKPAGAPRARSSTVALSLGDWFKQNFPGKHAMLSYQWDIQDKVVRARKRLEELGVPCWQDIDGGMQADIYVRPQLL